jgi:alkanesulfonate monooxygenase SsuD/methylene tetrahydromethanopterin reductase-like flavin-dependent oxidoreductase (luciferase family)
MKFYVMANPFCWSHKDEPRRLGGTSTEAYQAMLEGLSEHAKVADELGFEGMFFSEQHGNIEGVPEVTNNPVFLDWFVASQTKRLKVGQLGCVLPVSNPLLVAEEIAQLDQMTQGRVLAGFSRGNTFRWVDQFGQLNDMRSATSDKSEADERNLRAFIEAWEIIKLAWTTDTFSFDGEFWSYPVEGKWTYPATKEWGAGVDADDNLTGVGIAPRPFQKPYPRVFSPISGRAAMVKIWAAAGNSVVSFAGNDEFNGGMIDLYAQNAEAAGRTTERGEGLVLGGSLAIGADEATAKQRADEFSEWYELYYNCPPYNLPHGRSWGGTPQQIIDQIGSIHEQLGVEEFMVLSNVGAPHGFEQGLEMLELFGREVIPALRSVGTRTNETSEPVGADV